MLEAILAAAGVFILLPAGVKAANMMEDQSVATSDRFLRYDPLFRAAGARHGVPWWRLKAICMVESDLGDAPSVARGLTSPKDVEGSKSTDGKSWGLMQVTIPTARDFDVLATPERLNEPTYSIDLAARFLATLQRQFAEEEFVVKAYNQGAGNTRKELAGKISGYANGYWEKYTRRKRIIEERQGLA